MDLTVSHLQLMPMQRHTERAASPVKEDVYVVGRSYNGKFVLKVDADLKPKVSILQNMFSLLVGTTEAPMPSARFEVPYQKRCFYVILDSKCGEWRLEGDECKVQILLTYLCCVVPLNLITSLQHIHDVAG